MDKALIQVQQNLESIRKISNDDEKKQGNDDCKLIFVTFKL